MKTIEIQNCTEYRDNLFKVFVNGEKHIVRFQSKIQVADDKPIEIKAKYFWDGSPVYTFEPKDNIALQISKNWPLTKCFYFGPAALSLIFIVLKPLLGYLLTFSILVSPFIFYLISRKKFVSISVVSEDNADMSDKCLMSAKSTLSPENNK